MKKTFKTLVFAIVGLLALASCEDVPAPYMVPTSKAEENPDEIILPSGNGTLANPYNVAKLQELIAANQAPTEEFYIKGKISSIKSLNTAQYTRAQYYISDNGKTKDQFYVYNGLYLNGENFTSDDQIKVGDEVVILGKLGTYNGTYQIAQNSKIVSLNAQGSQADSDETIEPSGSGTKEDPYNVAKLKQLISENKAPTGEIYIKGVISQIKSLDVSKYTRAQYYISDNGKTDNQFYVYNGLYLNGENFTSDDQIKVGDKVVILGTLGTYQGEYQVAQNSKIISLNAQGSQTDSGETIEPSGSGTKEDPYNVAKLKQLISENKAPTGEIYIKGVISQIKSLDVSKYTRAQYYISDNGKTKDQFYVYNGLYLNGENFTSDDQIKVGDKVVILGTLGTYQGEYQVAQNSKIVSLNDNTDDGNGGGSSQSGDIQHITIAEFLAKADPNTTYELTGTVKNIANTTFGNFDLVEGDASIYIYGLLDLEGKAKNFANIGITEGDEVTLTGVYKLYNNKPEIVNAQLISFKKGEGGGDDSGQGGDGGDQGGGGDIVTDLVNGDFESWVSDTEPTGWNGLASNAVLNKSTETYNGNYACIVKAPGTQNKRLATQEITLAAGSYTFSFYAKSTTENICQTRAGYAILVNGELSSNGYHYGSYVNINNNEWTHVSYDFEVTASTSVCLIAMNPAEKAGKTLSQDILVDDATLVKK